MKTTSLLSYLLAAATLILVACGPEPQNSLQPERVELDHPTLNFVLGGDAQTLFATVFPEDLPQESKKVNWHSLDINVATVSQDGVVEPVGVGTTTLTVATEIGGKTAECTVNVTEQPVPVESVSIKEGEEFSLAPEETKQLTALILPTDATNLNATWESDSESTATVDENGLVTAHDAGTAIITVKTQDGGHESKCTINVSVGVTSVTIEEGEELSLAPEETKQLTALILPTNATNLDVTWESDNESAATVDANGLVTAHDAGTAVITVTTKDGGLTDQCTVTVSNPVYVEGISLKWETATVEVEGLEYTMTATVTPEEADNKSLTWSSSNPAIASVNSDTGAVTGITVGTSVITATAADGNGVEASYKVTVMTAPDMTGCATGTPRFGETLGEISFMSDKIWKIGDQLWSDAVLSSVASARTSEFQGRDQAGTIYYLDCRNGHDGFGDFFTWGTAAKFRAELCPDGWRIPTTEDFIALDIALGGTGANRYEYLFSANYVDKWGGGYGGNVTWNNTVQAPNAVAYWLSQTVEEKTPSYGKYLGYMRNNGNIYVNQSSAKEQGMMLRCVR